MTPMATTRADLITWSQDKSPEIKAQCVIIAENLRLAEQNPFPPLLAQTMRNVVVLGEMVGVTISD